MRRVTCCTLLARTEGLIQETPDSPDRDRFVLSKGHGAPVLFQVLAERGFFPVERLSEFGKSGSVFHEHPPKPGYIPGVEAATGSLVMDYRWHWGWQLRNEFREVINGAMRC